MLSYNFKPNDIERKITKRIIDYIFNKYIEDIDCIFWQNDDIMYRTIYFIRTITYIYLRFNIQLINELKFKDDKFIDKEINRIKTQIELIDNNKEYTEEYKQYFILYSLIILILDYIGLLDENDDNNNTNNKFDRESLELLIYLIQNSLYKCIDGYNHKLIFTDLAKLKLLLSNNKTKDCFTLVLSNLKLYYLLDIVVIVNKNFINNCKEYISIKNDLFDKLKEIDKLDNIKDITNKDVKSKKIKTIIIGLIATINFIKNNIIPLLFLSKVITDIVNNVLQNSVENKTVKPETTIKTSFSKILTNIFSKTFGRKIIKDYKIKNKPNSDKSTKEAEYIEFDPDKIKSMFRDDVIIKEKEITLSVNSKIETKFESINELKDKTFKILKTTVNKKNCNLDNKTIINKSDTNYIEIHSKVSSNNDCNDKNDDLNELLSFNNDYIDKNNNDNNLINNNPKKSNNRINDLYNQELSFNNSINPKNNNKNNLNSGNDYNNLSLENLLSEFEDDDPDKTLLNANNSSKPNYKTNKLDNNIGWR